ncbi:acyl-CoA thioesterase [Phormidium tenue]|uniref:1,4-dihydroxy-2-naphthoyl-CoA hydrolase n=1 Tax=Phormidium tenue NIES-30 TaxID=549789 RepID=A0A1U7IXP5_9CYAN|nr:thioesterase family protein [Phormidium tenue]MBD2235009.1 acyl-CoA thioesterase [Phormidium tenue FACHB-1052]OKH43099.1 1,4-dihydroxy-2-naphthoyl-CoA hydrolase [Phormidium tenue NIES-30]
MGYIFEHQVRFHETDGAGVVYFANELVMCHTAYEASLAAAGLDVTAFFRAETLAYPIVHTSMDYRHPLRCGDRVTIHLTPTRLDDSSFEIQYQLTLEDAAMAQAVTRHVCIEVDNRRRSPLPTEMEQWLAQWSGNSPQTGQG